MGAVKAMIKFLHCADLHLDSPLSALDVRRAEVRRNEMRAAFTSMTLFCRMNKADLLLISGDLFDGAYVTKDTIALMKREFEAMPDCKVVIAPGNHDPYTPQSYYRREKFPDNVFIFRSGELSSFDFPELNTTVYGWAFTSDRMETSPLDGAVVDDPNRINLLAAHCDLDAAGSPYCPVTSAELEAAGFDYAALGHRHTFSEMQPIGGGYAAYAGCLEGRGFDETGVKGAVICGAKKEDGQLGFASKFMRFCKRRYECDELDVTGAKTNADVVGALSSLIAGKHYGDDVLLRVRLTGNVAGDLRMSKSFLVSQFPSLFCLDLIDATVPLLDAEELAGDPTIRGAFYRSLAGMLTSSDPKERETAALALRYGLSALAGGEVTDY